MQLPDYPHIFAAGDAIYWEEQKSARKAYPHARAVWTNIRALLANPAATNLSTYRGAPEALPLTNGKVRVFSSSFGYWD